MNYFIMQLQIAEKETTAMVANAAEREQAFLVKKLLMEKL